MRSIFAMMVSSALCGIALVAQTTSSPTTAPRSPAVTGFMHAIHATNDVSRTAAFYRDVFGLHPPEPTLVTNANVPVLTDSPSRVTLRVSMLQLPGRGFNFELTEFANRAGTPRQPRLTDPGAAHLKILVRDIAPVVAAARRTRAPIITASGAPVTVTTSLGTVRAIFMRDPDGYIVEAIQAPAGAEVAGGNVHGAIMGVAVGDIDESLKFWHDMLGFDLTGNVKFSTDSAMQDLMGIGSVGSFRTLSGRVPGSNARIEFTEFKGVSRSTFDLPVTDPGAAGMALRVAAIQNLLPRLKAAGIRVVSRNGELVEWSETVRNVFVKDPNGLNLELVGTAAGR